MSRRKRDNVALNNKFIKIYSGPTLVPDVETGLGAEVKRFRELLDSIPVDVITFGLFANPQLQVTEPKMPAAFKKFMSRAHVGKL